MNIFIDTISDTATILLFDNNRDIINKIQWIVKGNESSTLIPQIDKLLKTNNIDYKDLENIVVVNGPGSFTWVRTTVLAINSINYIINKNITAISYFDLFDTYPIVKTSSKRDCFVQKNKNSKIEIIPNDILKKQNISIEKIEKVDYLSIIKKIKLDNKKQIEALYIKKPNIS